MEKTCTGCVVSAGTHKPAEALHQQIAEPQPEALRLADECEESATHWVHEIDTRFKAAKMLRAQQARIAELEDAADIAIERIGELEGQLEAIGAGGVESLRKQAAEPQAVQAAVPVAWRLTNTAFRKPRFEYHDTKESAEQRQADFNRSVDDGGLHNLTPLYAAHAHPAEGVPAQASEWDGKLPERLQSVLNALRLELPAAVVNDVEFEVRSHYEAMHTSLSTSRRMYGAARDRLEAIDAAQPDPFASTQPAAQWMDAKDAARYRWLRRNVGVYRTDDGKGPVSTYLLCQTPAKDLIAEETDAAIDAALAAQAKQGGA